MKQLRFYLTLIVIISFFSIDSFAYDALIGGIYYNFTDSNAIVTSRDYRNNSYSGNVVIPESVYYNNKLYTVTTIGNEAFSLCSKLESVSIPISITSIGREAFKDCVKLKSISIPDNVTSIGKSAFSGCGIKSIVIPSKITIINNSVFKECPLKSVTIPDNVTTIGESAFEQCWLLSDITIANSVIQIQSRAFFGCESLSRIIIPNSVTDIGDYAFANCYNLESFTYGSGVLKIGKDILSDVKFSEHIPSKVFWMPNTPPEGYENSAGIVNYVSNNKYLKLNNKSVYSLLSNIFECDGIVYVPISTTERTCEAIDCNYNNTNADLIIRDKVTYKNIEMNVINFNNYFFYKNSNIRTLNWISDNNIPTSAFSGCRELVSAKIGGKSSTISTNAFSDCLNLESIEIGDNIKTIGSYAFSNCSSLIDIQLSSNVNTIKDHVFKNCSQLATINIPNSIMFIYEYAFEGCSNLKNLIIEDYNDDCIVSQKFFEDKSKELNSEHSIVGAGTYHFDVKKGDYLLFSYSVERGNLEAQINKKIILSVNSDHGHYITKFENDQNIMLDFTFSTPSDVWINKATAKIYGLEVGNSYSLHLESNGEMPLFSDCPLDSIYIGRQIAYSKFSDMGYSPFYCNSTLRSITINNKVNEIFENEFRGCSKLKNTDVSNAITKIGSRAFLGCISLEKYVCGSKVTHIGQEAFSNCPAIKRFISCAVTPPVCDLQALDDINKWECILSVPEESTTAYQQADQWKDFFFIDNDLTSIRKLTNDTREKKYFYDISGRKLMEPKSGLNIIHLGENGKTKKYIVK